MGCKLILTHKIFKKSEIAPQVKKVAHPCCGLSRDVASILSFKNATAICVRCKCMDTQTVLLPTRPCLQHLAVLPFIKKILLLVSLRIRWDETYNSFAFHKLSSYHKL